MIWKLKRIRWQRRYDITLSMVVRAVDEQAARNLASRSVSTYEAPDEWLDPSASTCEAVPANGPDEVIESMFRHG